MRTSLVSAPTGGYLAAVRRTLDDADDALLCVAFAQARGVHLVEKELEAARRRGSARIVVTTTLGATPTPALAALVAARTEVRVLNPGGATYHPKVFLGRARGRLRAVVGSANLTSGLVANVEAGVALEGSAREAPLAELWSWAEALFGDPRAQPFTAAAPPDLDEAIEPELLAQLAAVARESPTVYTLGPAPRPNLLRDVTAAGLWVETERSRARSAADGRAAAQLVPPRMLNLAWDALRARGRLSNRELLDELRVHRSSFVCAVLARLPGVAREEGREVVLRYAGPPA